MPLGTALLFLAWAQETWEPKPAVTQGEERLMDLRVELPFERGPLVYTATIVEQVSVVDSGGGWTLKTEHREPKMTMAGQDAAFQTDAALQSETTYAPNGAVVSVGGEAVGNDSWRTSRLLAVVWPGRPLDKGVPWDWAMPADTERGIPGVNGRATWLGPEEAAGKPAMKVTFEAQEPGDGGASVRATAWFDATSCRLLRLEASLKAAPLGSGQTDAQVTLSAKTAASLLGW